MIFVREIVGSSTITFVIYLNKTNMKTAEEIVRKRKEEEKHILYKVSEN
jgi:hypothetical protein